MGFGNDSENDRILSVVSLYSKICENVCLCFVYSGIEICSFSTFILHASLQTRVVHNPNTCPYAFKTSGSRA